MPTELTDAQIAEGRRLARYWIDRLYPWCRDGEREDAEQYAVIQLWRSMTLYDPERPWDAWASFVIRRKVSEYMARADCRQHNRTYPHCHPEHVDEGVWDSRLVGNALSSEPIAEIEARWQLDLACELAGVSDKQRATILAVMDGDTYEEAGKRAGITSKGAEQRIYQARKQFMNNQCE